jgi:acyl-CoA thioester hydrolase
MNSLADYADAEIRVRYAETDQMGVVYHSNYFVWFEVGRVQLCRQLGFEYQKMEVDDDTYIVVARASCCYKRPARFDDLLTVRTRLADWQRRMIRFAYQVFNQNSGDLLATGETLHVICDRLGRPKSLPEKYRKYFSAAAGRRLAPQAPSPAETGESVDELG